MLEEKKQGIRVLLTAIGSFSAPIVIERLKKLGAYIVATDIYPREWVSESQNVDIFLQAPRASEEEVYFDFIKNLVIKEKISHLIPLIDVEVDVLNRYREALEELGITLCISPKAVITLLRDKYALYERGKAFLAENPDSVYQGQVRMIPTEKADVLDMEELSYPFVLKPVDGRSSSGLYTIYNEDQLGFAFACIQDGTKLEDQSLSRYILQPKIQGNVVTVDILRDAKGNTLALPREEFTRTPNGAGIAVKVFRDEKLERFCKDFADALSVLGVVNFEFIKGQDSGIYYFLECNPRFSGGTAFSVHAGLNLVEDVISVFTGGDINTEVELREASMTRKYIECIM